MFHSWDRQADSIHAALQRSNVRDRLASKFSSNFAHSLEIRIHNSYEIGAMKLAPHARMIAPKIAHANHGDTNRIARAHFARSAAGTTNGTGAKASIVMLASSAAAINASRSKSKVFPASSASAVAFA